MGPSLPNPRKQNDVPIFLPHLMVLWFSEKSLLSVNIHGVQKKNAAL